MYLVPLASHQPVPPELLPFDGPGKKGLSNTLPLSVFSLYSLTPRVKPWVIQSFVTFDSVDRTLKCDHSLESC